MTKAIDPKEPLSYRGEVRKCGPIGYTGAGIVLGITGTPQGLKRKNDFWARGLQHLRWHLEAIGPPNVLGPGAQTDGLGKLATKEYD